MAAMGAGMTMTAAATGGVKALAFDVFGTVVDWRSSIIRDGKAWGKGKGLHIDWANFADRWRAATLQEFEATPADARPARVAHVVSRFGRVEPTFHGASIEWFAHADAITANDAFLDDNDLDSAVIIDDRFVVDVCCVFGQDWFDERWNAPAGTRSFILVGLLEKADFLTRTQFRDYWAASLF